MTKSSAVAKATAPGAADARKSVAPTCLVVDDEPAILRLVVLVLRDLGYETLAAPDAETAAGILAFRRPDLIITDIRLPGADGLELARQVKETPPLKSTPILLISAYGEPRSHPADGFLPKPFDIDGLTEFVAPYSGGGSDQARDEPRQTKTPGRSSR